MVSTITYGVDFNYYKSFVVASTEFKTKADVQFRFRGQSGFSLMNMGDNVIEYSFNGTKVHGTLVPDTASEAIQWDLRRVDHIWFRAPSGSSEVRVEAWAGL